VRHGGWAVPCAWQCSSRRGLFTASSVHVHAPWVPAVRPLSALFRCTTHEGFGMLLISNLISNRNAGTVLLTLCSVFCCAACALRYPGAGAQREGPGDAADAQPRVLR
jgi:hypothetical protein